MADPRNSDPNRDGRRGRPADRRPRSSGFGLILAAVLAILVLIGFIFWPSSPPAPDIAPQGESPQTEAPSGTEPSPPEVPEQAPQTAPQQ